MRRKVWGGISTVAVVALAVGGYAWADARDMVPGILTDQPPASEAAPFLAHASVSGVAGPALEIASFDADAPMPDPAVVQELAQALRDDSRTGASTNVAVVDVLTGTVLADVGASDGQVPASTTKHLTSVAALGALGPDFTTRTTVWWDDSAATLTLVAGGDMMLAADAGHAGEGPDANGWAGLGDLAELVVGADVVPAGASVTLVVDDLAFPGPPLNPEWPDYAPRLGYGAGVSGLAVNIAKIDDEHFAQRHVDPSLAAGADLSAALEVRGIDVSEVTRAGLADGAVEVAAVESAPLAGVVEFLMRDSDNTIAENLGRVLAIEVGLEGTPQGAAQATIAQLAAMGVDTEGLELYDGAGFSANNRISPLQLTQATMAALADPGASAILDYLAIAGAEGTVAERYADTDAAGVVRAKTGSLTGVTSLTGTVVTADGRLLAFALLADGMPPGQDRPRAAFEVLVVALANCGCQRE